MVRVSGNRLGRVVVLSQVCSKRKCKVYKYFEEGGDDDKETKDTIGTAGSKKDAVDPQEETSGSDDDDSDSDNSSTTSTSSKNAEAPATPQPEVRAKASFVTLIHCFG